MRVRRTGSGQWRPWAHVREGADGFYRQFTWRRGILTMVRQHLGRRACRAERLADCWTKGGAAGRRVREQHVVCADFKGLGKVQGALERHAVGLRWRGRHDAGAAFCPARRHGAASSYLNWLCLNANFSKKLNRSAQSGE
jgi:hypothetical protein